jgi:hypothetical protein
MLIREGSESVWMRSFGVREPFRRGTYDYVTVMASQVSEAWNGKEKLISAAKWLIFTTENRSRSRTLGWRLKIIE